MPLELHPHQNGKLTGHALRNANLRKRSLRRAQEAPPLARAVVNIRAGELEMTRLEFCRKSGISRGTLRDLELGVHVPTRRVLRQLIEFCHRRGVQPDSLEELRRLYAGSGESLEGLIARLELKAGSAGELARRVGISPSTLWEYQRGRFPLPLALLRKLCQAVGEDPATAEPVWQATERQRLLDRAYPAPLAEFWALCHRMGCSDKDLPGLGVGTEALRRLRYLELPPWQDIARAARAICRDESEVLALKRMWGQTERDQRDIPLDRFGPRLQMLRKQGGIARRELADLFGLRGKKPAQAVKHIEEGGAYSAQAYPAGLAAILTPDPAVRAEVLRLWEERRERFHRRHRPETRVDMRLKREAYGFEIQDMEQVLGYPPLEYQRIERGVTPLSDTARARILIAIDAAGQRRVAELLERRQAVVARRSAWRAPPSVAMLVELLAEREGGLVPLVRFLKRAGVHGVWPGRVKAIIACREIPPWPIIEQIGKACAVEDMTCVRRDWQGRYRGWLEGLGLPPLAVEVRLLIAETASSARALSCRLRVTYPVLTRDLQRIDRGRPVRWACLERILEAAGVQVHSPRWERIQAWWLSTVPRR